MAQNDELQIKIKFLAEVKQAQQDFDKVKSSIRQTAQEIAGIKEASKSAESALKNAVPNTRDYNVAKQAVRELSEAYVDQKRILSDLLSQREKTEASLKAARRAAAEEIGRQRASGREAQSNARVNKFEATVQGNTSISSLTKTLGGLTAEFNTPGIAADKFKELGKQIEITKKRIDELTDANRRQENSLGGVLSNIAASGIVLAALRSQYSQFIDAALRAEQAEISLSFTARNLGIDNDELSKSVQSLTADGLLPLTDASQALRNLLETGLSIEQATKLISVYKDEAALGRAPTLTLQQAVGNLSESFKTESSIIGNLAGQTENYSLIVAKGAAALGKQVSELTEADRVQAKYLGTLEVAKNRVGGAAELADTFQTQQAKLNAELEKFNAKIGKELLAALRPAVELLTNFVKVLESIPAPILAAAVQFATVAGGIFALSRGLSALGLTVPAILNVARGLRTLAAGGSLLSNLFPPLRLLTLAIGAAAAAYQLLQSYQDTQIQKSKDAEIAVDNVRRAVKALGETANKTSPELEELNKQLEELAKKQANENFDKRFFDGEAAQKEIEILNAKIKNIKDNNKILFDGKTLGFDDANKKFDQLDAKIKKNQERETAATEKISGFSAFGFGGIDKSFLALELIKSKKQTESLIQIRQSLGDALLEIGKKSGLKELQEQKAQNELAVKEARAFTDLRLNDEQKLRNDIAQLNTATRFGTRNELKKIDLQLSNTKLDLQKRFGDTIFDPNTSNKLGRQLLTATEEEAGRKKLNVLIEASIKFRNAELDIKQKFAALTQDELVREERLIEIERKKLAIGLNEKVRRRDLTVPQARAELLAFDRTAEKKTDDIKLNRELDLAKAINDIQTGSIQQRLTNAQLEYTQSLAVNKAGQAGEVAAYIKYQRDIIAIQEDATKKQADLELTRTTASIDRQEFVAEKTATSEQEITGIRAKAEIERLNAQRKRDLAGVETSKPILDADGKITGFTGDPKAAADSIEAINEKYDLLIAKQREAAKGANAFLSVIKDAAKEFTAAGFDALRNALQQNNAEIEEKRRAEQAKLKLTRDRLAEERRLLQESGAQQLVDIQTQASLGQITQEEANSQLLAAQNEYNLKKRESDAAAAENERALRQQSAQKRYDLLLFNAVAAGIQAGLQAALATGPFAPFTAGPLTIAAVAAFSALVTGLVQVPQGKDGLLVGASEGGTLVNIGEAGNAEAAVPLTSRGIRTFAEGVGLMPQASPKSQPQTIVNNIIVEVEQTIADRDVNISNKRVERRNKKISLGI